MGAIGALLVALGIIGLIWGAVQKFKAGRLAKAPFVKTGDVASKGDEVAGPKGAVSVEGDVSCPQPVTSPTTDTECLYYELKVVGSWKEGDSNKSKTYVEEKVAAPFTVDDGTGAVPVSAEKGGDFDPMEKVFDETKKEGFLADLKGAVGKGEPIMFGSYAFENPAMSKANKFTCTERVLKMQPRLFVLGKHQEGCITSPSWTSLIMSSKNREELLGATAKSAKMFLLGGAGVAVVGLILGIVSAVMAPDEEAIDSDTAAVVDTTADVDDTGDVADDTAPTDEVAVDEAVPEEPVAEEVVVPKGVCGKAYRCCMVASESAEACAGLIKSKPPVCRKSLRSFRKAVKATKPAKLSACR